MTVMIFSFPQFFPLPIWLMLHKVLLQNFANFSQSIMML